MPVIDAAIETASLLSLLFGRETTNTFENYSATTISGWFEPRIIEFTHPECLISHIADAEFVMFLGCWHLSAQRI